MGCGSSSEEPATRKVAVKNEKKETNRGALNKYAAPKIQFTSLLPVTHGGHVPRARKAHTLTVVDEHSLFFYGGLCTSDDRPQDPNVARQGKDKPSVSSQVFHFTPRDLHWHHPSVSGDAPTARATHVAVGYEGSIYVYGSHNQKDNELHQYKAAFARWIKIEEEGNKPRPMAGASACVAGDLMLIFGGDIGSKVTNDLYAFEFLTNKWHQVEDTRNDVTVMGRRDHSAVVFEDKMLVFGGFGRISDELEFIQFSASSKSWSLVPVANDSTVPERRGGHCASLYHHFMFVFGGMHHRKFLNDLHVFNVLTNTWTEVKLEGSLRHTLPSKRGFAVSAICGHLWYLHGGTDDESLYRDFYSVDANELTKAADPTFVPPDAPEGAEKDENGEVKKLKPGDAGYNKFNVKYFSPMWNDVVNRSSKPVIGMM